MNKEQRKVLHKYRDLEKWEIIKTILTVSKIKQQILFNSSILELCEYLKRLEEIFGKINECKK